MWMIALIIVTAYLGIRLIAAKINLLAVLWYFAERGLEIPQNEDLEPYYEKVIRKMMKID